MEKLIPTISIVMNIGSAAGYAWKRDWPMVGYWIAAAYLTFCITYLRSKKKHITKLANSDRLKETLCYLQDWPWKHTTASIARITKSVSVHSDIDDLRHLGYDIECKYSHTNPVTKRRIYTYEYKGKNE